MSRYLYVFYRYYQKNIHEYCSFEDALHAFISDFDYHKAYGIGIYDREDKVLYLPNYFSREDRNWAMKEIKILEYEIEKIQYFDTSKLK